MVSHTYRFNNDGDDDNDNDDDGYNNDVYNACSKYHVRNRIRLKTILREHIRQAFLYVQYFQTNFLLMIMR